MKDKIIKRIIEVLIPLKTLYQEIDLIINDLENDNYDSLTNFVNEYYKNDNYSQEFLDLLTTLVKGGIIDNSFLILDNAYEFTNFNYRDGILYLNSKAINLTSDKYDVLRTKNPYKKKEIKEEKIEDKKIDDDVLIDVDDIEAIRKIILDSQLSYLNNANLFISKLENSDEDLIYHTLLNLNDIRYIQHCISNLSLDTLKRLLSYIEITENNKHNLINTFMEEAIKKSIHQHKK
ncbi:MAG: hypothetical protein MR266_02850 [Erysipelotrichaceae bacterium]|nr:hypothetical protein [Erysipelotrichaceae bacterium]